MWGPTKTTADGSDVNLEPIAQNAALDAIDTLCNTGGGTPVLEITTAADTGFAASPKLCTLNLNATNVFGTASAGSMSITGTPSGNAAAAGTAGLFRILNKAGAEVLRGTVGAGSGDINFSNNVFGVGTTVTLSTFSLSLPATASGSAGVLVFAGGLAFTSGETIEVSSGSYLFPAT
jgi:hypothetical protein